MSMPEIVLAVAPAGMGPSRATPWPRGRKPHARATR